MGENNLQTTQLNLSEESRSRGHEPRSLCNVRMRTKNTFLHFSDDGSNGGLSHVRPFVRSHSAPPSRQIPLGQDARGTEAFDADSLVPSDVSSQVNSQTKTETSSSVGSGQNTTVQIGNSSWSLREMYRLRESGVPSLGSVDHGSSQQCTPCMFEQASLAGSFDAVCRFGFLCDRCHQYHPEYRRVRGRRRPRR